MTSEEQQKLGSRMRIDENAEFTVVGLGPGGIMEGSYNVINEYAAAKSERPDERGDWAYLSVPNYDVFHTLVIGKSGENTVSDINFNLQLGLTQIYIEAHSEVKEAVKRIRDIKPASKAEQDLQDKALRERRDNLHEVTTGIRNSWDLQAAVHVWRSHWQGGRPQRRFDQVLYQEILDAWKVLRDKMGEADDLVGVGWLDSWIKGFLDVYIYEDDFYQQLLTWNMIHDVGDADYGHESIRLWQAEINKFRYKHRKILDIPSTMAGIKERMAQFRVMIMDPGSFHGWAAGGWYWQVKTDQFRSLATQLMDLDFRQRLQAQPESQHKFEELDRLALEVYKQQTIETCKKSRKSAQAVQMIEIWHSTFGLLINYDMICTGYLWSYIRSTSQMDTDVFILSYQDIAVKKGGWTCPITVELIATFQIGLRGFIKRRTDNRTRRKRNSRQKPKSSAQDGEEPTTASSKLPAQVTQESECSDAGRFEDAELIHEDGKRTELKSNTLQQSSQMGGGQSGGPPKHDIESEKPNSKKKKKKKKTQISTEEVPALPTPPAPTGDLMRVGVQKGELALDIKNSAETTDIDDAWQAAKQEFIGRTTSGDDSLATQFQEQTELATLLEDTKRLKMMNLPDVTRVCSPSTKAVSALDWFDETNESTASTNDEWYSAIAKQIQIEGSQSNTADDNMLKENKTKLRPGVQWSQIVGGGAKTKTVDSKKNKQITNVPKLTKARDKNQNISRTDDKLQKKNKIAPDQKGKGKAIATSKEASPTPQVEIPGPIGLILPSIGPWTEVSKKRKQAMTESESKINAGRDRIPGKAKAKTDVRMDEVMKISERPMAVEPTMKETSNLFDSLGKRQITAKAAEADSPPALPNVLRIVSQQVQPPVPQTGPSVKGHTADATKSIKEQSAPQLESELPPVEERTASPPSSNSSSDSQVGLSGRGSPGPLLEQFSQAKILATESSRVSPTTDETVSVVDKAEQIALTALSTMKSPVMSRSDMGMNVDMFEECQASLDVALQDIGSPTVVDEIGVLGGNLEDRHEEGLKQGLGVMGVVFESGIGSGGPPEPTEVPGIRWYQKKETKY